MENGNVLLEAEKEYQKQYRFSRWWIEHRDRLRRLAVLAFAVVDGIVLFVAGWPFVDAYLVSYADETRAVLEMAAYGQADLHAYTVANAAQPLREGGVSVLPSAEGKYDLYAVVTNPNDDWWAEFSYAFSTSAGEVSAARAYVLPGAEMPLVAYGVASAVSPRSTSLSMTDIVWHRVDHHVTGAFDAWISDRLNFEISEATFAPIDLDGKPVSRAAFTVTNATAYGYYEPVFLIRLLRGSTVVGVTATTLSDIDAGETSEVAVNWIGTVPSANKVEVVAVVNPFDIDAYKPLEGETTEDTRTRVQLRGR